MVDDEKRPELNGMAVNVTITVRLLRDGHVAAKAYGRPTAGGRGGYTFSPVPAYQPRLTALVNDAATHAGTTWTVASRCPVGGGASNAG